MMQTERVKTVNITVHVIGSPRMNGVTTVDRKLPRLIAK